MEKNTKKIKWTDLSQANRPLTDIQISILNFLGEKESAFLDELAREFNVSNPTIYNAVKKLKKKNLVRRVEISPGTLFVPHELMNRIAELHKSKIYPAGRIKYYHWITLADGVKKDSDFEALIDE